MLLLAEELVSVSQHDIQSGYGSLIFTGCFFLALIGTGIWWLKRQV